MLPFEVSDIRRATVSWQQTKHVTVSDTRHPRSPAGCHSGLIISQPVSGRVALLPVVTDTRTKGEATLRRQKRCTFHVLITSSHTAISDS